MTINQRFEEIIQKLYSGNKRAFSKAIGVSPTVIENVVGTRKGNPSFEVVQKVVNAIANIDTDWLITGDGTMLRQEKKSVDYSHAAEPSEPYVQPECRDCKLKDKVISALEQQVNTQQKLIDYLENNAGHNEDGQKRKVAC
jgi:hypothetical protein